tara:strand:+ start:162 stop:512 length:351 start_codon:yes stop_codon:yes gene_type:complete
MKSYPINHNDEILWAKFIGEYKYTDLLALQINDSEGLPYMTASVNVLDQNNDMVIIDEAKHDDSKRVVIKDYSENKGIEKSLKQAGIINNDDLIGIAKVGHVACNVYKVKEDVWKA